MNKGKKRARTLSLEGLDLFNIGVNSQPLTPTPQKKKTCLRSLLLNLFTTDFDIKLEKSTKTFRKGTCCLYSYLTDEEKSQIPDFFNNLPPFLTLQDEQAVTTLFQSVFPPLDLGNK